VVIISQYQLVDAICGPFVTRVLGCKARGRQGDDGEEGCVISASFYCSVCASMLCPTVRLLL
jgi:hypothetical protein